MRTIEIFLPSHVAGQVTSTMLLGAFQSATVQVHRFGSEYFGGGAWQLEGSIDGSVYTPIRSFNGPCFIEIPKGLAYAQVRCMMSGLPDKLPSLMLVGVS